MMESASRRRREGKVVQAEEEVMPSNSRRTTYSSVKNNRGRWSHGPDYEQAILDMRARLLRLARLCGVPEEATEDVVQETFLVGWKKLDRLHSPEGLQIWLYEICRRVSARYRQAFAKASARKLTLLDPRGVGEEEDQPAELTTFDPAEILERQDLSNLLCQALDLLPDQTRQAIERYYLLDQSEKEVALSMGLSISALETRLHRARARLRQILSNELRTEAAALDVPISPEAERGWPATGMWCYYCGHHKLHATFETLPGGQRYLRMRCPGCSTPSGFDIVNSRGAVEVGDLHSFRPAFKRTMREVSRRLMHAVSMGHVACERCGRRTPFEVTGPKQDLQWVPDDRLKRNFWIRGKCPGCGYISGGYSADDAVYWSQPAIEQFIRRYPHWLSEVDVPLEYQGRPAIMFRLSDHLSQAQLHVLTHRETLEVLDIFERH
jgi:RNA polymerase sigma factor (sigma-70 family)